MPNPSTIAESEDVTEKWNELDRKLYHQQRAEIARLKADRHVYVEHYDMLAKLGTAMEAEITKLQAENDRLLAIIKTKNELIERLTLQLLGVK